LKETGQSVIHEGETGERKKKITLLRFRGGVDRLELAIDIRDDSILVWVRAILSGQVWATGWKEKTHVAGNVLLQLLDVLFRGVNLLLGVGDLGFDSFKFGALQNRRENQAQIRGGVGGVEKKRVRKGLGYQIIHLSLLLLLLLLHPKVVLVDASMLLLHAVELFLGALLKGTNKIECCIMQRV